MSEDNNIEIAQICAHLLQEKKLDFPLDQRDPRFAALYHKIVNSSSLTQKDLYLDKAKLTDLFRRNLQKFETIQMHTFLCSRMFKHGLHRAYKCYNCALEENSIICEECFEKEKHIDHNYELTKIQGGCCDCGDDSQWSMKGFCSKHSAINNNIAKKDVLKKQEAQLFLNFCSKSIQLLLLLYKAYLKRIAQVIKKSRNQQGEIEQDCRLVIKKIIDDFGSQFLNQIIQLIKNRYIMIELTRQWAYQKVFTTQQPIKTFKICSLQIDKSTSIHQLLMVFTQLQKASNSCYELLMLLFYGDRNLKRDVTLSYIRLLSKIPLYNLTNYHRFSPQLLNSSQIILDLIKHQRIQPLIYQKPLLNPLLDGKALQYQMQNIGKSYQMYCDDIFYLLQLKKTSFQAYWSYFGQKCGFDKLTTIFNVISSNERYLQVGQQKLYYLEEYPILFCMKIISKIDQRQLQGFLINNLKKITFSLFQIRNQIFSAEVNTFFTNQRIWALFLFAYFFKCENMASSNQITAKELTQLLKKIYDSQNKEKDMIQNLVVILQALANIFYKISCVLSENKEFQSFQKTYFKKRNILFWLDSFLFRFIIRFCQSFKKQFDTEGLISKIINGKYRIIENQFNQNAKRLIEAKGVQRAEFFKKLQKNMKTFTSFTSLVSQSVFSDIGELGIFSMIKGTQNLSKNLLRKYKQLYNRVLKSMNSSSTINRQDFLQIFRALFFKNEMIETDVFKQRHQLAKDSQYALINFQHFFSLQFKLEQYNNQFNRLSYKYHHYIEKMNPETIFQKMVYLQLFDNFLYKCIKIPECHRNMINNLALSLVKIQTLAGFKSPEYTVYFTKLVSKIQEAFQEENKLAGQSKKQKKQINVKMLFSKQMRKCLDLEQQSSQWIFQFSSQQHEQSCQTIIQQPENIQLNLQFERICALGERCQNKQKNAKLLLLCYVSFTNKHSCFGFDPEQKILTFDTCHHHFHSYCLSSQSKKRNISTLCPKCAARYNITFNFDQDQNNSAVQVQNFEKLQKFFYGEDIYTIKNIIFELTKSLVVYLISFVYIDQIKFLEKSLELYKLIYRRLKLLIRCLQIQFPSQDSVKLKQDADQVELRLIRKISNIVVQKLFQKSVKNDQPSYHTENQQRIVKALLSFFQSSDNNLKLQKPMSYARQNTYLTCKLKKLLPKPLNNLSQLLLKCSKCQNTNMHSYQVCLFDHIKSANSLAQCFCLCYHCCTRESIKKHIIEHHVQDITMIITDTGELRHYHINARVYDINQPRKGNNKTVVSAYLTKSLYRKNRTTPYSLSKGEVKKEFILDDFQIKHELNRITAEAYQAKTRTLQSK